MAAPIVLPPAQIDQVVRLLRALDLYRLLDHDMMRRVGLGGRDMVSKITTFALRRKLVDRTEARVIEGTRRLPFLYWLTHKGAATLNLQDGLTGEDAAIGAARRFGNMHEVLHRVGLAELHIAARAWCHAAGIELDGFMVDFEPGSYGRQKRTTHTGNGWGYSPDGLAWMRFPGDPDRWLFVLEHERGGEGGDLYPFFKQKLPHMRAVAAGAYIEDHHDLATEAQFLIVFGSHVVRKDGSKVPLHREALDHWPDKSDPAWDRFFIKSEDEAAENFGTGWHQVGDRPQRDLFKAASATNSA